MKRCPICNKGIKETDQVIPFKGRTAHLFCFNTFIKTVSNDKQEKLKEKTEEKKIKKNKPKPNIELKDPVSEEEYSYKKEFYTYLRSIIGDDFPSKIYAIIDKMMHQYSNYTFEGMRKTLIYMNEIMKKELTGDVVGLIPYYYSEAEDFYKEVDRIDKENESKDISKMYQNVTVKIKPKKREVKQLPFD